MKLRLPTAISARLPGRILAASALTVALCCLACPAPAQTPLEKPASGVANTRAIVFNPVAKKVYAVDQARAQVDIVDTASQSVTRVPVGAGPVSIAVNEKSGRVYAASAGTGTVSVIDGATNAIVATLRVVDRPYSIAANSATGKVYVSHTFSDKISIIDCATNAVTQLTTGSIDLIAVDSAADKIYLLGYEGGGLTILDGAKLTLTRRAAGKHAWGMALDEATHTLYVARMGTGDVIVLNADSAATPVIPAGRATSSIAVNSRTNRIYAGNYSSGDVTVIDGQTTRAIATVRAGEHPQALAVDEALNLVYVANTKSDNVTVIDGATNKPISPPCRRAGALTRSPSIQVRPSCTSPTRRVARRSQSWTSPRPA